MDKEIIILILFIIIAVLFFAALFYRIRLVIANNKVKTLKDEKKLSEDMAMTEIGRLRGEYYKKKEEIGQLERELRLLRKANEDIYQAGYDEAKSEVKQ